MLHSVRAQYRRRPARPLLLGALLLAASCSSGGSTALPDDAEPVATTETSQPQPSTTRTTQPTTTTTEPTDPLSLFVSPQGDDNQQGTQSSPYQSINKALTVVAEGGVIHLQSGVYGPFEIVDHRAVTIVAATDSSVLVDGGSYSGGPGINIVDSEDVTIADLEISQSLWGIWIESSDRVNVVGNTIFDLGQEGVMVKHNSSNVLIEGNTIHTTGQRPGESLGRQFSEFGEAIYIGNAGPLDDGTNDEATGITVRNNTIHTTTAEAVDIKPWADDVLVEGNLIYNVDTATSGAIVVGIGDVPTTADNVVIRGNVIHSVTRTSMYDHGNAIVVSAPATVIGNVIWDVQHYGVLVDRRLGTLSEGDVLISENVILDAGIEEITELENASDMTVLVTANVIGADAEQLLGPSPNVPDAWAAVQSLLSP